MNKSKIFIILYYLCLILSIGLVMYSSSLMTEFGVSIWEDITSGFVFLNIILVLIFSLGLIKRKLKNINIIFPIIYLIFMALVVILMFIINNKLIMPYIHFDYYISFILFDYLLLNLYSVLSIYKK